ncbi:hypothetical protein BpHYR1_009502 [Brachionus plicatilis]|uniref:Uncharacterized protein n=1 Tax=Brachionus plicatilis TaxID=10195 RepID=A0A3M7QHG2_BRAPC|nr:hypothetical protein BpHYR1_009502 [Brachionus plicatilis]
METGAVQPTILPKLSQNPRILKNQKVGPLFDAGQLDWMAWTDGLVQKLSLFALFYESFYYKQEKGLKVKNKKSSIKPSNGSYIL